MTTLQTPFQKRLQKSSRQKPGSSNKLNGLDSGLRRNDAIAFMRSFLNLAMTFASITCAHEGELCERFFMRLPS